MIRKRIIGKSAINNIYRFPSQKTGETILTESTLEFNACFHFEYAPQVIYFESQPLGFEYELENKIHSYTADFATIDRQGIRCLYEIKSQKIAIKDSFIYEFKAKQKASLELGFELYVIDESQICIKPLIDNLKILHRYVMHECSDELFEKLISEIISLKTPTINDISKTIGNGNTLMCEICSLIAIGKLGTDLYKLIDNQSKVWVQL